MHLGDFNCGQNTCSQGNVYVDDKPVCDDDWDDTDANVVCKELGFHEGGFATTKSFFGRVNLKKLEAWDQAHCTGHEASLLECRHESHDDCDDLEGAGVVCYERDNFTDTYLGKR